jgi:two-component system, NarL family, invasion response regulator UvrY
MIKVLLVDDHALVRCGLAALLNETDDITVVADCDCGEQALQIIDDNPPDVILMDINMPGMGGIEASRRILKNFPNIKLIGLSAQNNLSLAQQLLKLGVEGFVSKVAPVDEMISAIRNVMNGNSLIDQPLTKKALNPNQATDNLFSKLSQRESEVVRLILQGRSIQEMSLGLKLSDKTINTYRYRVYGKLKIKNDVELTRLAVKYNYLEAL